jgi:hypothetical protein
MDRRFDRGQYEALLMDHRPLDPREGFCVWGQRREHYQRGKRMRYGELAKQCRLVILKALMKDESVRHWFLYRADNLRPDEIAKHLFIGSPLSFDPPLWLTRSDLYLFSDSGILKALTNAEIVVGGVLALSGSTSPA